jgi:hypothetical protein
MELVTEFNVPHGSCPVCFDRFCDTPEQALMKTKCHHFFHQQCIAEWYVESKVQGQERAKEPVPAHLPPPDKKQFEIVWCPVCRQTIEREHVQSIWQLITASFAKHSMAAK